MRLTIDINEVDGCHKIDCQSGGVSPLMTLSLIIFLLNKLADVAPKDHLGDKVRAARELLNTEATMVRIQ